MCEQATLYAASKVVAGIMAPRWRTGSFGKASLMVAQQAVESPKDAGSSLLRWPIRRQCGTPPCSCRRAWHTSRTADDGVWLSESRGLAQGLVAMELRRGRPRPRDINSGRVNSEGIVQWSAERMPRYVFWDPKMEVADDRTRTGSR